jgi:tetratricopeptide (TPR) repeat protein
LSPPLPVGAIRLTASRELEFENLEEAEDNAERSFDKNHCVYSQRRTRARGRSRLQLQRGRGRCHLEEALADYNEAIRLNPGDAQAYVNRGFAKAQMGRLEEAIADFNEAIRLNPGEAASHHSRGMAQAQLGRFDESLADCEEAIRLNPGHAPGYNSRGVAKAQMGPIEEALVDFDEAIRLNPRDARTYYNRRGHAKARLGRPMQEVFADHNTASQLNASVVVASASWRDLFDR